MEFGQAVIEDHRGRAFVTLDTLQETAPDPIATTEAAMLTHLVDDHGELVPLLLRLAQPQPEKGVMRVLPLAIDRYGVTLRLEYTTTHRDLRLPFAKPVARLDQAGPPDPSPADRRPPRLSPQPVAHLRPGNASGGGTCRPLTDRRALRTGDDCRGSRRSCGGPSSCDVASRTSNLLIR